MKNLDELFNQAKNICTSLNIPISNNISIKYNGRIRKCWGYCRLENSQYEIDIMRLLGEDDTISSDTVISIILHELLHTCPNCMNHGKIWKSYKKLIENNYDYKIYTKCNAKDLHIKPKYIVKCRKCGNKQKYVTRPHNVKYICMNCGSTKMKCIHKDLKGKELIWKN